MKQAVLVINCGSSSIKFALIDSKTNKIIEGAVEQLQSADASIKTAMQNGKKTKQHIPHADHNIAIKAILETLGNITPVAVGHRVVHGGEKATTAMAVDDKLIALVEKYSALAPLHNPVNLIGIKAAQKVFPNLPQVAVFDTAFHQTMPEYAFRYPLPKKLYSKHKIRRYGFHGTSHAYVSERISKLCPQNKGWLTAHLGNGCSVCAVYEGKSLDTSMGLTPLEGLMMGTRCGDIDPGIHAHMHRELGYNIDKIDETLNKQSGLLGVSGVSNDMRYIEKIASSNSSDSNDAKLAIAMFAYKAAKSLLSVSAALPNLSGIVFTGGIGENGAAVRANIVQHLAHIGAKIDTKRNSEQVLGKEGYIHSQQSKIELWVVPTDEEGRIAQETRALIKK